MKKYQYKNIKLYQTFGKWSANYSEDNKTFALHVACTNTKAEAYKIAKDQVNYLNSK